MSEGIVCVVDDEAGMRLALARLLEVEGFATRLFASAEEFLIAPPTPNIGCLLLDVSMPGLSGLDLQQRLLSEGRCPPIVFLTACGDIPMGVQAIKAGAAEFLTKPTDAANLFRAVRSARNIAAALRATDAKRRAVGARYQSLTVREREVMALVVQGKPNKQIAAELRTGEQNIKVHRGRAMKKMGAQSLVDLVRAADLLKAGPDHPSAAAFNQSAIAPPSAIPSNSPPHP